VQKRLCDKSRMTGDCHVRFRERLGVRFPRPTRPSTRRVGLLTADAGGSDDGRAKGCGAGEGMEARAVFVKGLPPRRLF
jgi:hypothetical protein